MPQDGCVICYASRYRTSLRCRNKHAVCSSCLETGKMLSVCSNGCPCAMWKCPCCREESHAWTHDVTCAKTARAIIDALQRELRNRTDDSDDE